MLDKMIAGKRAYLEKKPNSFIEKEITDLEVVSKFIDDSTHVIVLTQFSYKLLLQRYELEFEGKINPDKYPTFLEFQDFLQGLDLSDK